MAQLIAKPHRRPKLHRPANRPQPVERLLRDVAFVLHLTAQLKREVLRDQPRPTELG